MRRSNIYIRRRPRIPWHCSYDRGIQHFFSPKMFGLFTGLPSRETAQHRPSRIKGSCHTINSPAYLGAVCDGSTIGIRVCKAQATVEGHRVFSEGGHLRRSIHHPKIDLDACYERGTGSTFWLNPFLNNGSPETKIVGVSFWLCNRFRYGLTVVKPWDCSSGSALFSPQNQFLSEV